MVPARLGLQAFRRRILPQGLILQNQFHSIQRVLLVTGAALLLTTIIPACLPLAATGALIGASVSVDRRTVGTQIDDQTIQLRANQRIKEVLPGDDKGYAYVTSHNRRVLLTGLAPDARSKARAEQIAASIDNVRGVYNELNIGSPNLLSSSARDTLVTAKVRSALFQDKTIEATALRVLTELRTVYLMGLVTRDEGTHIAKVASQIPGVDKVVTIFDFISDQDLQTLQREREKAADKPPAPVNN